MAPIIVLRDALAASVSRLTPETYGFRDGALESAIEWLCLTHEVTGRAGSSKGFSLFRGWLPAYPETTGYVIGTLLEYAQRSGVTDYVERAREMGDWEVTLQEPDGGIMEGVIGTRPRRSIVFNTGMVLHGWLDLHGHGHHDYLEPATRAGTFLVRNLRSDGTWDPQVEYAGVPHTYNARVAWAMLRLASISGRDDLHSAALRHLDWVLSKQRGNGWFESCVFKAGMLPSTHSIAYTLRGLLESYGLTGDRRCLEAATRTTEVLMRKLEVFGCLPATYAPDWTAASDYVCLTGTAQLGGVWLRLYQLTDDARYLNSGLKAVEQAAKRQEWVGWRTVRGALAGSFPVWGRYAPLQYPNWATKFLADALMLREDCLPDLA